MATMVAVEASGCHSAQACDYEHEVNESNHLCAQDSTLKWNASGAVEHPPAEVARQIQTVVQAGKAAAIVLKRLVSLGKSLLGHA